MNTQKELSKILRKKKHIQPLRIITYKPKKYSSPLHKKLAKLEKKYETARPLEKLKIEKQAASVQKKINKRKIPNV